MKSQAVYSSVRGSQQKQAEDMPRRSSWGRWLFLSVGAVGAVGAFARWIAEQRRERSMQLAVLDKPAGDALMVLPDTNASRKAKPSRAKGKMARAYDEALQNNSAAAAGREGMPMERPLSIEEQLSKAKPRNNGASNGNGKANNGRGSNGKESGASSLAVNGAALAYETPPAPVPASNATSAPLVESKMTVGEELRDREFPVPEETPGAASRKTAIDQETLHDGSPRMGGAAGTQPGDKQPGEVPSIFDQAASVPDLPAQS